MKAIRTLLLSVAFGLSMGIAVALPEPVEMTEKEITNKVISIYLDLPKSERKALLGFYKANQAMIAKLITAMNDFKTIKSVDGITPAIEKHRLPVEDINKISDFIRSDIGMSIVKIAYKHVSEQDREKLKGLIKTHATIAVVIIKEVCKHISEKDRQDLFKALGLQSIEMVTVDRLNTTVDLCTMAPLTIAKPITAVA